MILNITIEGKIATYRQRDGDIVCGNSDYSIKFTFDAEWSAYTEKTARFKWNGSFIDVPFTGDTCAVPTINNATECEVGVYAGDLCTTTPAVIGCKSSILCGGGSPSTENDKFWANEAKEAADEAKAAEDEAKAAAEEAKKAAEGAEGVSSWNDLKDKPSTFPPSEHTHPYILTSEKGKANGVASLDSDGKVPSAQLPSLPTVDAALSDTSTNAVQNKVVKAALDEIKNDPAYFITTYTGNGDGTASADHTVVEQGAAFAKGKILMATIDGLMYRLLATDAEGIVYITVIAENTVLMSNIIYHYPNDLVEFYSSEARIPANTSELNNDSGYQTEAQVTTLINNALGVIENGSY